MTEQNPELNPEAEEDSKWKKITEESEAEPALEFPSHEQLEGQLDAKEKELAEAKEQLLRARAEVDNVQRRAEREISNAFKYSINKLLGDLLPVVDSLVRGLEGSAQVEDPQLQAIRHGMQLTLELLEKTLDKYGVQTINPEPGESFNPQMHEAMGTVPNSGFAPNSIVQVLQKGYQLHDRVLRAAMVMVSA
ncbi:MAG TPA: nucleotide exchange factor GrpE [Coxiellaceae bacterium]|nr:nucleotide exchange factor GrpE [Coxiellaceae bacterium]